MRIHDQRSRRAPGQGLAFPGEVRLVVVARVQRQPGQRRGGQDRAQMQKALQSGDATKATGTVAHGGREAPVQLTFAHTQAAREVADACVRGTAERADRGAYDRIPGARPGEQGGEMAVDLRSQFGGRQ